VWLQARDESACAGPAVAVALGHQLLEGLQHRQSRDPELAGQRARGRQAFAGLQAPGQDGGAVGVVDLPVERGRGVTLDRHDGDDVVRAALHRQVKMVMSFLFRLAIATIPPAGPDFASSALV
jgi:hypothetical protein